uniref:Ovule protein n=1 Tax=Heterorhabditis bacteriophora TaxID=37862 RepID=A0A1I7W9D7_HETBA
MYLNRNFFLQLELGSSCSKNIYLNKQERTVAVKIYNVPCRLIFSVLPENLLLLNSQINRSTKEL